MKFSDLAPKALCDYYNHMTECPKDAQDILERLLTEIRDMDIVWDGYRKAFPEDTDLCIVRDELFPLIVGYYRESTTERRPWSESIEKSLDIANKANGLARCIKDTEFNLIISQIDLNVFTNHSSNINLTNTLNSSTVYELLKHIEREAKAKIHLIELTRKAGLGNSPFRFSQNRGKNAHVNYFIRKMALVFYMHFGSYRERMLTRLVSVVLNLTIDETKVSTSLREWHKTYPYLKEIIKSPLFLKGLLEPEAYYLQVISQLMRNI